MADITKTWLVTSDNPRPSHAEIDGETVAYGDPFGNGLYYPGDPTGDVSEVAGCTCIMTVDGEAPNPIPQSENAGGLTQASADLWLSGETLGPATDALTEALANVTPGNAPTLYRGVSMYEWSPAERTALLDQIVPGATLPMSPASFTTDIQVAQGYASPDIFAFLDGAPADMTAGGEIGKNSVILRLDAGANGVDMGPFATGHEYADFAWQKEWVAGGGNFEVRAVEKGVQGETQVFIRAAQAPPPVVPAPAPAQIPDWMSPSLDDALQSPVTEDGAVGTGVNAPRWGTVTQADGSTLDVVTKVIPSEEQAAELAAQSFNEDYGFNVLLPRSSENPDFSLVQARAPGRTGLEIYESRVGGGNAAAELQKAVLRVPLEERRSMVLFDQVIGNLDRNDGNWLITADRHLVALDHGLAFTQTGSLTFGGGGALFDSAVRESLTAGEMALDDAERASLEAMVQDEASIRQQWEGFVDVDAMFERIDHILQTGQWRT